MSSRVKHGGTPGSTACAAEYKAGTVSAGAFKELNATTTRIKADLSVGVTQEIADALETAVAFSGVSGASSYRRGASSGSTK
jgi:hypothetical protein